VGAAIDGEAVGVVETCTALAAIAPDKEAEAEVMQYMTSKLLVCQALIKVSMRSEVYVPSKLGGMLTLGSKRYYWTPRRKSSSRNGSPEWMMLWTMRLKQNSRQWEMMSLFPRR
jgi:hypothetical protein